MKTEFFDSLIDDFGIWQHTDGHNHYPEHGYALDDSARGLLVTLLLDRDSQSEVLFDYLKQSRTSGVYSGFAHSDRQFFRSPASEDATSQTLWAYGLAISKAYREPEAWKEVAVLRQLVSGMEYLRGPAYALLGAVYLDQEWASELASQVASYFIGLDDQWPWPEQAMTYALGIIPYCLLRYQIVTGDGQYQELALATLDFVERVSTTGRHRGPVGNHGWHTRSESHAPNYSQQPIDAGYMVWAHMAAYQITGSARSLQLSQLWMDWFKGDNIAGQPLINPVNHQCFDGIDPDGINTDSGAESNICYILSLWVTRHQKTF
jgi:hypothetical protein